MELLQFILSSAWNFIGTIILIIVTSGAVSKIIKTFVPVQIRYETKQEQKETPIDYKNMWSDLISTWNKKPGNDKK